MLGWLVKRALWVAGGGLRRLSIKTVVLGASVVSRLALIVAVLFRPYILAMLAGLVVAVALQYFGFVTFQVHTAEVMGILRAGWNAWMRAMGTLWGHVGSSLN